VNVAGLKPVGSSRRRCWLRRREVGSPLHSPQFRIDFQGTVRQYAHARLKRTDSAIEIRDDQQRGEVGNEGE
jgi:hypothetical protein